MPAPSPAQQHFFGMVLAAKRGKLKNPSAKVKKVASSIDEPDAKDFAATSFKKKRSGISKSLMSGY